MEEGEEGRGQEQSLVGKDDGPLVIYSRTSSLAAYQCLPIYIYLLADRSNQLADVRPPRRRV